MLAKLLRLTPQERSALLAASLWVSLGRMLVSSQGLSLRDKQRWLEAVARRVPPLRGCSPERAAWAVTAVARRMPGTYCLSWALALRGLLAQAGSEATLRIGVAAAPAGALNAHAWIDCDGRSWSWGDDTADYRELRVVEAP
jgi:hypothetical protein